MRPVADGDHKIRCKVFVLYGLNFTFCISHTEECLYESCLVFACWCNPDIQVFRNAVVAEKIDSVPADTQVTQVVLLCTLQKKNKLRMFNIHWQSIFSEP